MNSNKNKDLELKHLQDSDRGFPRRNFLKGILGATAATAVLPYLNCNSSSGQVNTYESFKTSAAGLSFTDYGDEQFWLRVKEQFPIRENLIMLNAANLCPSSLPVQKTLFEPLKVEHDRHRCCSNSFSMHSESFFASPHYSKNQIHTDSDLAFCILYLH